jgi:hypothetical protein
MGKYDDCVHLMNEQGKSDLGAAELTIFSYDRTIDPHAPFRIEAMFYYKKDMASGYGTPFIDPWGVERGQWPHTHYCDEIYLLLGTDHEHPLELGGVFELWIGEGEEAEKIVVDKAAVIRIPAGVVHLPLRVVELEKPFIFVAMPQAPIMHDATVCEVLPPLLEKPDWVEGRRVVHSSEYM